MPITPENLVRHELLGLEIEVFDSSNNTQILMTGKVIDESFKTLKINTKKGEKIIPKQDSVFVFKIPDGRKVKIDGNLLLGRPEDRIKKKLPKW